MLPHGLLSFFSLHHFSMNLLPLAARRWGIVQFFIASVSRSLSGSSVVVLALSGGSRPFPRSPIRLNLPPPKSGFVNFSQPRSTLSFLSLR